MLSQPFWSVKSCLCDSSRNFSQIVLNTYSKMPDNRREWQLSRYVHCVIITFKFDVIQALGRVFDINPMFCKVGISICFTKFNRFSVFNQWRVCLWDCWQSMCPIFSQPLRWRHNGLDSVSNHQPHHCLLSRLFGRTSRKHQSSASLAFVRGIHRGPVNFPAHWMASNAENVSIWWRHHVSTNITFGRISDEFDQ